MGLFVQESDTSPLISVPMKDHTEQQSGWGISCSMNRFTPQPLYNTVVGVQIRNCVSQTTMWFPNNK